MLDQRASLFLACSKYPPFSNPEVPCATSCARKNRECMISRLQESGSTSAHFSSVKVFYKVLLVVLL